MRRLLFAAIVLATACVLATQSSCGFAFADDSGQAIPDGWWPWVCPDGGVPSFDGGPDGGCE